MLPLDSKHAIPLSPSTIIVLQRKLTGRFLHITSYHLITYLPMCPFYNQPMGNKDISSPDPPGLGAVLQRRIDHLLVVLLLLRCVAQRPAVLLHCHQANVLLLGGGCQQGRNGKPPQKSTIVWPHVKKLDDGWPESAEEQGLLLLVWRRKTRNDI